MWHFFQNSQQSMQHAGEWRDSYSPRNTNTDVVVKHFLWWTSKWTVHVKPEHTMWTKTQEVIKQETGHAYTHVFILSPQGQAHINRSTSCFEIPQSGGSLCACVRVCVNRQIDNYPPNTYTHSSSLQQLLKHLCHWENTHTHTPTDTKSPSIVKHKHFSALRKDSTTHETQNWAQKTVL